MTFTKEQLETVARAGGFSRSAETVVGGRSESIAVWTDANNKRYVGLPDFPNDLQACFDVLEKVLGTNWSLHCQRDGRFWVQNGADYTAWEASLQSTKQNAILAAILKLAKEGQ